VPMVVALLRALAEKGKLDGVMEDAKKRKAARASKPGEKK
jgi:hypothetical protein